MLDDFSCGPLQEFQEPGAFWSSRRAFWTRTGSRSQDETLPFVRHEERLSHAGRIIVWIGTSLREQILLVWMGPYLRALGVESECLEFIEMRTVSHFWFAGADDVRIAGEPIRVRSQDGAYFDATWRALTSPDPSVLTSFLRKKNSDFPSLSPALRRLLGRYPDVDRGLNVHEMILLRNVRARGPLAARVIGHSLVDGNDAGDPVGDIWLFDRLRRLASGAEPAVVLSGDDTTSIRGTAVRLTEFGRAVLERKANYLHVNGIDEWIGGVHLDSTSNQSRPTYSR